MRIYYVIRDSSPVPQTREQRETLAANLRQQIFAGALAARASGPNEQLEAAKISLNGELNLGGIDLDDPALLALLDSESRRIDARFSQTQRQLELVLLAELRAALPQEESARSANLSVEAVAFGERGDAIAAVRDYLRVHAAEWYASPAQAP
jgi:hypothetical protein